MAMQNVQGAADTNLPAAALRTFVAVCRSGSIRGAADQLHLSQPAVSRRLQGLERQLRAVLFERSPQGLRLTEAGRALLPHAERALAAESDGVRAVAERTDQPSGSVAIGVVGSLIDLYLAPTLRRVVSSFPDIELEVTTATSSQVNDLVRRGEVALGVSYAQHVDADLVVDLILEERLVVVGSLDHPAAGTRLDVEAMRRHRWLVFPDPGSYPETSGTIARRELERCRVPGDRLRDVDSLTAQRALATAGYGLALLPESMIADDLAGGRLVSIDAPLLAVVAPVTLVVRKNAHLPPAAQVVIDLLRAH